MCKIQFNEDTSFYPVNASSLIMIFKINYYSFVFIVSTTGQLFSHSYVTKFTYDIYEPNADDAESVFLEAKEKHHAVNHVLSYIPLGKEHIYRDDDYYYYPNTVDDYLDGVSNNDRAGIKTNEKPNEFIKNKINENDSNIDNYYGRLMKKRNNNRRATSQFVNLERTNLDFNSETNNPSLLDDIHSLDAIYNSKWDSNPLHVNGDIMLDGKKITIVESLNDRNIRNDDNDFRYKFVKPIDYRLESNEFNDEQIDRNNELPKTLKLYDSFEKKTDYYHPGKNRYRYEKDHLTLSSNNNNNHDKRSIIYDNNHHNENSNNNDYDDVNNNGNNNNNNYNNGRRKNANDNSLNDVDRNNIEEYFATNKKKRQKSNDNDDDVTNYLINAIVAGTDENNENSEQNEIGNVNDVDRNNIEKYFETNRKNRQKSNDDDVTNYLINATVAGTDENNDSSEQNEIENPSTDTSATTTTSSNSSISSITSTQNNSDVLNDSNIGSIVTLENENSDQKLLNHTCNDFLNENSNVTNIKNNNKSSQSHPSIEKSNNKSFVPGFLITYLDDIEIVQPIYITKRNKTETINNAKFLNTNYNHNNNKLDNDIEEDRFKILPTRRKIKSTENVYYHRPPLPEIILENFLDRLINSRPVEIRTYSQRYDFNVLSKYDDSDYYYRFTND